MNKKQKKKLIKIVVAVLMVLFFSLCPFIKYVKLAGLFAAYLIVGYDILKKAVKGILKGQVFDENFLMAAATVGAIALNKMIEACAVLIFYELGELFESYAVGKSRKNISELMDIRPDYANIKKDGELIKVDPDEVITGQNIFVRPGEKVPIDGIVVDGKASVDTSALTGESVPRTVRPGDEIISGCINLNSLLEIKTTREFGESTVSKILELVENSSLKKARSENFIAKFAKIYTPLVCIFAVILALFPPIAEYCILGNKLDFYKWIYRGLTFLVISCPCALVISIPLSFFAGIGGASREGILIKGSNYLETLSKVDTVVFDKTGTMTKGVFEVVGIHHNKMDEKKLLWYVAHAESSSTHPISKSILRACEEKVVSENIKEVNEISGKGIRSNVAGKEVLVGNEKLMEEFGIEVIDCHGTGTIIHVAIDGKYEGHLLISDMLKPGAKNAIKHLKSCGVNKCVMLTGDTKKVAQKVASELDIEKVYSDLLPADKVTKVEELLDNQHEKGKLAFVGDGINDAPVLSRADVGIAMGALGSDAAIEAADVVLMDDDPLKIAKAIRLSKKCMRIVHENIYIAIGIKVICLLLGAVGIANMWLAIFADVGVMILAVLNAIRAMRCR